MKAQSSLLIIISVVVVVIISWAYTSFNQASISESETFSLLISKLTGRADTLRGFFRDALIISTHAATDIVGSDETKTFYCNGVEIPSENQIRLLLSEQTLNVLNSYTVKLEINDPLIEVDVENFTCIDIPDNNDISSGNYDEGFNVDAYGSRIRVRNNENKINSSNEIFDYVSENRFWLLYRKMGDWVSKNGGYINSEICQCLDIMDCSSSNACDSGSCPHFADCIQDALDDMAFDLQESIDDQYIKCSGTPSCCYTHRGESCLPDPQDVCEMSGGGQCFSCKEYPDDDQCIDKIQTQTTSYSCGGTCSYWRFGSANVEALLTCKDKKYQLSIPGEERFLGFTVEIVSSLSKNGVNEWTQDCEYDGAGSCVCPDDACTGSCPLPEIIIDPGEPIPVTTTKKSEPSPPHGS